MPVVAGALGAVTTHCKISVLRTVTSPQHRSRDPDTARLESEPWCAVIRAGDYSRQPVRWTRTGRPVRFVPARAIAAAREITFRKVAQRARARLRALVADYEAGERCRSLADDLAAYVAHVAGGEQSERVRRHLTNCPACAQTARELERVARGAGALLPVPPTLDPEVVHRVGLFGARSADSCRSGTWGRGRLQPRWAPRAQRRRRAAPVRLLAARSSASGPPSSVSRHCASQEPRAATSCATRSGS